MPRRLSSILVLLFGLLSRSAQAEPYVLHLGKAEPKTSIETLLAPYRPLGLSSLGELRNLPGTLMVDMPASLVSVLKSQGFEIESFPEHHLLQEEHPVPWHLDRENQRALPLDGNTFHPYTGRGVRIFIIDGEIFRNPEEFGDRLVDPGDYAHDGKGPFADCGIAGSHATGVASMAAGNVYGVAPGAEISPKRIFDCKQGISGPDYYKALDDIATWKKAHPGRPAIVNMSYGGPGWRTTEHKLLQVLDRLGVLLVDAAGNENIDACPDSPAGYPETITASASTKDDHKASWAARGTCVDIFAPGESVPQRAGEGTQEWFGSGTSASAPGIAGAIALMLEQIPDLSSAEVRKLLLANATAGALQGDLGKGSPNRLIYTGPIQEEISSLTLRWNASKRQFTVQVAITLNGKPTPLGRVLLYRGDALNGRCQGKPLATIQLPNGSGKADIIGLKQPPGAICLQTRSGSTYALAVGPL